MNVPAELFPPDAPEPGACVRVERPALRNGAHEALDLRGIRRGQAPAQILVDQVGVQRIGFERHAGGRESARYTPRDRGSRRLNGRRNDCP